MHHAQRNNLEDTAMQAQTILTLSSAPTSTSMSCSTVLTQIVKEIVGAPGYTTDGDQWQLLECTSLRSCCQDILECYVSRGRLAGKQADRRMSRDSAFPIKKCKIWCGEWPAARAALSRAIVQCEGRCKLLATSIAVISIPELLRGLSTQFES